MPCFPLKWNFIERERARESVSTGDAALTFGVAGHLMSQVCQEMALLMCFCHPCMSLKTD